MSAAWWLNTAWMISCRPTAQPFQRSMHQVRRAQERVLQRIVRENGDCEFGRVHGFAGIGSVEDFRRRVPPATWENVAPAVKRIAAGEQGVLTAERVELLEPTSGTTCAEKLVPYTASLRREFQIAVACWIADLFHHHPAVRKGRAYWSISPAMIQPRRTAGGISIGFDDDTAYLGRWQRLAVQRLLAVPPLVARLRDLESWRYYTLLFLVAAENLSLISVWSPSFLTTLVGSLPCFQERICRTLFDGGSRPADGPGNDTERQLAGLLRCSRERARQVDRIFAAGDDMPTMLQRLWPMLGLISTWADAGAAMFLSELRALFPEVEIQPKGLLATEGCVSIPRVGREGCALALDAHFFEFEPVGDIAGQGASDDWLLADELSTGQKYRVVLTTGGGLYRYQLRDVIEVVGFEHKCPLVRFVGKADRVGDLVGEKLAEPLVRECFERICAELHISPSFALVVPVADARPPHYRLYLEAGGGLLPLRQITALQERLQAEFVANPYYEHAIQLGQLAPLDVRQLAASGGAAWCAFVECCVARGHKAGAVKPTVFDPVPGWPEVFEAMVAKTTRSTAIPSAMPAATSSR